MDGKAGSVPKAIGLYLYKYVLVFSFSLSHSLTPTQSILINVCETVYSENTHAVKETRMFT